MILTIHTIVDQPVAEFTSEGLIVARERDAITLLEELYGSGATKIILHRENLAPAFFDLSSRLAGEILQKLTQYGIAVAIVGDFSQEPSKALQAFIYESNRGNQVYFTPSVAEALQKFSRQP